ncbi:MAG: CvpA family protein [SAR324 cluster bacterium]|nr:CvpA family protein [SAR324 cluster bacterium]
MAVFDIVILSIIAVLAIIGYFQGLVREIAQVLGMIVGVLLAGKFAVSLAAGMPPAGWSLILKTPIAAVLILTVTYIFFFLIGFFIRKIIMRGPLKLMDRMLGMTLGIIKGAVLVIIILSIMLVSPAKGKVDDWAKNSPVTRTVVEFTKPLVEDYYKDFEKVVAEKIKDLGPSAGVMTANAQVEILKLIKDLGGKTNPQEITEKMKDLTPEAREYLEDIVKKTRDGAKDASSTADLSWFSKQLPMDEIAKALGLDKKK